MNLLQGGGPLSGKFRKSNFGRDGYWLTHALVRIQPASHLPSLFLPFLPAVCQISPFILGLPTKKETSRVFLARNNLALSSLFLSFSLLSLSFPFAIVHYHPTDFSFLSSLF